MIEDSRAKTLIVPVQSGPVNPPSRRRVFWRFGAAGSAFARPSLRERRRGIRGI